MANNYVEADLMTGWYDSEMLDAIKDHKREVKDSQDRLASVVFDKMTSHRAEVAKEVVKVSDDLAYEGYRNDLQDEQIKSLQTIMAYMVFVQVVTVFGLMVALWSR